MSCFSDFDHVFCPHCGLRVSGPFQSTGKDGNWRGQCTDQQGCQKTFEFELVDEQES